MQRSALSTFVLASLLIGCSALIEPDPARLGGGDDGGAMDGGAEDAGDARAPDGSSVCPAGCDDAIACTVDACEGGRCTHTPDDAACAEERCSPVLGCVPLRCSTDEECSDGIYCNGEERCDPSTGGTGCVGGAPPACADDASCTNDRCDEDLDRCAHEPDHSLCTDAVACTADTCDPGASGDPSGCAHAPDDALCVSDYCTTGATCDPTSGCTGGAPRDCSDGDPCTTDRCASSAGACMNDLRDDDGDGAPAASVPGPAGAASCPGTDCDDGDPSVHPGVDEVCDGADNDCDGLIDDGCPGPDDCATAEEITVAGAGLVTVEGFIERFTHDYDTNAVCGAQPNGRDAVYYVDLPSGTWDVTIDTDGSAIDTVLGVGVGRTCSGSVLRQICSDDYDNTMGTASRVWVHRIESPAFGTPTRLHILLDTWDDDVTSGRFQLNVRLADARADRCPSAGALAFDMSGGGSLLGFQSDFLGSRRGSCQSRFDTEPEAVFFVRGPSSGLMDLQVYSADFVPDIYLRDGACTDGTELDCDAGTSLSGGVNGASIRETVTPGDPYYFFVDGGRTSYAVFYEPY